MSTPLHTIPQRAEECHPLPVGEPIPAVTLTTFDGHTCSLRSAVNKRPAFLVFYRGGW